MSAQYHKVSTIFKRMNHVWRKSISKMSDQANLKQACSATETFKDLEILDSARMVFMLSFIMKVKGADRTTQLQLCSLVYTP